MRKCKKCFEEKELSEFRRSVLCLFGRRHICKICSNKQRECKLSSARDKIYFGGLREKTLVRDKYACVICGMTDKQHRTKWNRSITVDHIDGNGRYSKIKNNKLENLQTLCLPCHTRKDNLMVSRVAVL